MKPINNRRKLPFTSRLKYARFIENLDKNKLKQNENNKNIDFPDDNYDFKKWHLF